MKIINNQLGIKLGQFIQAELDVVLTKINSRKAADLDEILSEVGKKRKFDELMLHTLTQYITRTRQGDV